VSSALLVVSLTAIRFQKNRKEIAMENQGFYKEEALVGVSAGLGLINSTGNINFLYNSFYNKPAKKTGVKFETSGNDEIQQCNCSLYQILIDRTGIDFNKNRRDYRSTGNFLSQCLQNHSN
jgi:hypothetical protein